MKKLVLSLLVVLSTVVCIAAKRIQVNYTEELKASKAYVEYNIPNITDGAMMLSQVDRLFCLMPYDVQEKMVLAFRDIIYNPKPEFTYGGVKVKHTDTTWEFYCNGASVVVRGATESELSSIFRIRDVI
jgi:hypothetical protein